MIQLVLYLSFALLIAPTYAQDLSDGEIAGIAIGAVAGFVIIIILLLCCCYFYLTPREPTGPVIAPPIATQPPMFHTQPQLPALTPQIPSQNNWWQRMPGYNFGSNFGNWWGNAYNNGSYGNTNSAYGYY